MNIQVSWIVIFFLVIIDILLIIWIVKVKSYIKSIQSNESVIAPVYYCDFYQDPTSGELEPGSPCYVTENGSQNKMVAYRYDSNGNIQCQNTRVSNNIVLDDFSY